MIYKNTLAKTKKSPVQWFRDAAPYIHSHRGKTFVIFLSGNSVHQASFTSLARDISLLQSLGIKVVAVHGARVQIEAELKKQKLTPKIVDGLRVTDDRTLTIVKEKVSDVKLKIEAALSIGMGDRQVYNFQAKVASGNFIKASPIGIINGVDFRHSGKVRKVNADSINELLAQNVIVLLSSLGFSAAGEVFNLNAEDVATKTAIELKADKLLILNYEQEELSSHDNTNFLTSKSASELLVSGKLGNAGKRSMQSAITACKKGISRVHLLNSRTDGILLEELFTPGGAGILITDEPYEKIRGAKPKDVATIVSLVKPLQKIGILAKRTEAEIQNDIDNFYVLEQDQKLIGVIALYVYPKNIGEIACVVVHPDYQQQGHGAKLLKFIEMTAKTLDLDKLFILSTQTMQWFMEHSYVQTEIAKLPIKKQDIYNYARNSKPFIKRL